MKKKVILSINQCYFWIDYLILYLLIKKSSNFGFDIRNIVLVLGEYFQFDHFDPFLLILLISIMFIYRFLQKKNFLKWVDLYTKMLKIKLKYWVQRLFEKNSNQYPSDKGLLMNKVKVKRSK